MTGRRIARRSVAVVALALPCLAAAPIAAQVLDLGGPDAPPAVDRPSRAQTLGRELEEEIADRITREPEASSLERLVLRSSVNLRVIAADLLAAGDEAEGAGSEALLAGLTLANGREQIDATLQRLLSETAADAAATAARDAARDAIHQFNEDAVRRADAIRTAEIGRLDRAIPAILSSLADAVSILSGAELVSHWPSERRMMPGGSDLAGAGDPPSDDSLEALQQRLGSSTLPDETRALLAEILAFIRRADPFADLRALADGYRPVIGRVFRLEDDLVAASWLTPELLAGYRERLYRSLVLFRDPMTRDRGLRRLERLERSRRTIERINELADDRRVEIIPVQQAFLAVDALADGADDGGSGDASLETLGRVVERMIQYRRLPALQPIQRLQAIYRQLDRRYRDAESTLLDELQSITGADDALSDPALASLLNDHRQRLDDLRRVQLVPGWIDSATLIHPPSGRRFGSTARQWCERLLDPSRRADAVLSMAGFERELAAYYPMPFERELRSDTPLAVQATGGFNEAMVAEIDRRRRGWMEQWSTGEVDAATARSMQLLLRLTRLMDDCSTVFRLGGDATALNGWAAWELPAGSLTRVLSELPSRLKLAVATVIEKNDDALARQLEQIARSTPLAQLLGRLEQRLESALADLPDGAAGTLGQLLYPPTTSAWMFRHRRGLADLCRYAIEESHARGRGQLDGAERLAAYVNQRAERLLETIDEETMP